MANSGGYYSNELYEHYTESIKYTTLAPNWLKHFFSNTCVVKATEIGGLNADSPLLEKQLNKAQGPGAVVSYTQCQIDA